MPSFRSRISDSSILRTAALLGLALTLLASAALARPGYLSTPDIHGDRIVFAAEGDLWTGMLDGDEVRNTRRLTSHDGTETWPRFSPDGKWIAFTGEYDGNGDIFVIPAEGGEPRRLTWLPSWDNLVNWTPDGQHLLFWSTRLSPHHDPMMFKVAAAGGEAEAIPIGRANYLAIDPESGRWAFTRTWGGGTWKRYRGGTAPEIWVGHPDKQDYREITDFDGIDLFPMWHQGHLYFLSDRGGTSNLWSMKGNGSSRRRLTDFDEWDVRRPEMGPSGRIVFALAGDIHLYNPSTDNETTLDIDLPSERTLTRRRYSNAGRYLTEYGLSPDGERVAIVARGEIFTIPVEDGVTLPITRGSGARESHFAFNPDSDRLVYITDESGEQEIVTADAWGRGEVEVIKSAGAPGVHFQPLWSPDGEWIAYGDLSRRLYVMPAEGGEPELVAHCEDAEIHSYTWSPDGRWLAYVTRDRVDQSNIHVYSVEEKTSTAVTSTETDDFSPAWDPDGRYLYFLSNRSVNPFIGNFDFETIVAPPTRPYMIFLRPDVENPFLNQAGIPPSDEDEDEEAGSEEAESEETEDEEAEGEKTEGEEAEDADNGDDAESEDGEGEETEDEDGDADDDEEDAEDEEDEDELEPIEIDFENIVDRYVELPVSAGRYYSLGATSSKLFFISAPVTGMAGGGHGMGDGPRSTLMAYDLEGEEASSFMEGVVSYDLQPGADKMCVSKGMGQLYVVGTASPPGDLSDASVSLSGAIIDLDPREEWNQIFTEVWRGMRDHYWDEGHHGLDWDAVRDQYATLLPRLATRTDLRDVLAEMIGELSTGHTYVGGGDNPRRPDYRPTGLLGAELEREGDAFRVAKIYRGGQPDRVRSPLDEPGVEIDEGDFITEVNLMPVPVNLPFESTLENMAGRDVMLTVTDSLGSDETRHVIIQPLYNQRGLIYADWVRGNREYVAEKTDGKIGYIHIPDMGGRGLVEFDTWFYPQLIKEGMIVDVRWNGGGFVSQLILSRFQRHIISWDRMRYGSVGTYPYRVLNGPFVVLTNENAGSDGDIFPAAIQLDGLAPVIGKRSWGGVVGIRGFKPTVDNGFITHPEFAWWDSRWGWGLEGHGVDPDIEVDNLPQELARDIDAQLNKGIEEVLRLHEKHPPLKPDFGPVPDRSRKAYRREQ